MKDQTETFDHRSFTDRSFEIWFLTTDDSVRASLDALLASWTFDARPFASQAQFIDAVQDIGNDLPDCLIIDSHRLKSPIGRLVKALSDTGLSVPMILVLGNNSEIRDFLSTDVLTLVKPYSSTALLRSIQQSLPA